ncbi:hypothetical protein VPH35_007788 [Triticum aestivum]|uniref:uncharacterized protein n=1 Tax=Triticum aestivum TaxID=4565 RepID=UPI0003D46756|nr:uncharacterized protein LOC123117305 [Triticum aestivum]
MWASWTRVQRLQAASDPVTGGGPQAANCGQSCAPQFCFGARRWWPLAPTAPPVVSMAQVTWSAIHAPRLELTLDTSEWSADLCFMRRSQSMEDLERRLRFAMVAYIAGASRDISPEFVLEALRVKAGITQEWVSGIRYRPEDFLVVFGREEHRSRVSAIPVFEHNGIRLFFQPWNRQAQVVHSLLRFKVLMEIEGIPPHAWDQDVVESLSGSSCMVDTVAPETYSRANLSSFKVSAWMTDPE